MNAGVAREIDGQLRYPSAEIVQVARPPVRGFGTGFAPLASGVFAPQKRARPPLPLVAVGECSEATRKLLKP